MNPIYVEIAIKGALPRLWQLTQEPKLHERWDLRFSSIDYLPCPQPDQPQRFRYTTRIGFGLQIAGEGETVGSRQGDDGVRTSALTFWSHDPKSLIREGSGYWQYLPSPTGVQFLTRYDYHVRFGRVGRVFDRWVFRPLLGWATAWSFDRLRLWLEAGIPPELAMRHALAHGLARMTLAFVWLYHGLIPKLIFQHADERMLLHHAGVAPEQVGMVLNLVGWGEVAFACVLLLTWQASWPFLLTIALMLLATVSVVLTAPGYLVTAFNPLTLNVLMIVLAWIGWQFCHLAPSARNCRRQPAKERL